MYEACLRLYSYWMEIEGLLMFLFSVKTVLIFSWYLINVRIVVYFYSWTPYTLINYSKYINVNMFDDYKHHIWVRHVWKNGNVVIFVVDTRQIEYLFHLEIFHEHKHIKFLSRSQNYIGSLCNRKYKLNGELKRTFFWLRAFILKIRLLI